MSDKAWEVLPPEEPARPDTARLSLGRRGRIATAFTIAVVSDLLSVWLEFVPPAQWALDVVTAVLLFLILGRQWMILPALIAEAVPGMAAFPTWALVVVSIGIWGTVTPLGRTPRP